MKRKEFVKKCCLAGAAIPLSGLLLPSCGSIYYAQVAVAPNKLTVAKKEFVWIKNESEVLRDFVYVKPNELKYPICLYKIGEDQYIASLLKCTHRGCELNVGGGIYTCPCHGSEFNKQGEVLQGPAEEKLKTYRIESDHENIYIYLND